MGILLYFIAAVGLAVLGIAGLSLGVDWWVWVSLIIFALGSLAISIYKLDEETGFISDKYHSFKRKYALKVSDGKFEHSPVNLITLVKTAIDERKTYGKIYAHNKALEDIFSAYRETVKNWKTVAAYTDKINFNVDDVEEILFGHYEALFAILTGCDSSCDAYNVYCEFCNKAKKTPLSTEALIQVAKKMFENDAEKYKNHTNFLKNVSRRSIKSSTYESLVRGFCYLMCMDGEIGSYEYNLLVGHFVHNCDVYLGTWENFKKELNK